MTCISDREPKLVVFRCQCPLDSHHYLYWKNPEGSNQAAVLRKHSSEPWWHFIPIVEALVSGVGVYGLQRVPPAAIIDWAGNVPSWVPAWVVSEICATKSGDMFGEGFIFRQDQLRKALQIAGVLES